MDKLGSKIDIISNALDTIKTAVDTAHHEREEDDLYLEPHARAAEIRVITTFSNGSSQIKHTHERLQSRYSGVNFGDGNRRHAYPFGLQIIDLIALEALERIFVEFDSKLSDLRFLASIGNNKIGLSASEYN